MTAEARSPGAPLVVRLCNWVGEVVLLVPALRRLQDQGYALQLIGRGWARGLLAGTGWPVTRHPGGVLATARELRALRTRLIGQTGAPPSALLFTRSLSSALEFRLAGLPAVGYAQEGRGVFLDRSVPRSRGLHAAEDYWRLVDAFLGKPAPLTRDFSLPLAAEQQRSAEQLLASRGLAPGQYVLFCPFSGSDDRERRKVWPGFGGLAQRLASQRLPVLVCPGPGEESRVPEVLPGAMSLEGVELGIYGALLARARAVVANDTGPGHIAAAVGARLISLYGPYSSVSLWGPRGARVSVLTAAGGWPTVDEVLASMA